MGSLSLTLPAHSMRLAFQLHVHTYTETGMIFLRQVLNIMPFIINPTFKPFLLGVRVWRYLFLTAALQAIDERSHKAAKL